jgi:hypothetical protein
MSARGRVGQLFLLGMSAGGSPSVRATLAADAPAGVFLLGRGRRGTVATASMLAGIQHIGTSAAGGVGLITAVDQEGSQIRVLSGPGSDTMPTATEAAVVTGCHTLRQRKTGTHQSEPLLRSPLADPRRIVARLLLVILCVAATGVAVTCEVIQIQLVQPPEQQTLSWQNALPVIDDASVSPRSRANQLFAWLRNGGSDLGLRFGNDLNRIASAVQEDPGGVVSGQGVAQVRSSCVDLGQFAHDADAYFCVPESGLQKLWQTLNVQSDKAAADCTSALSQRNGNLFGASIAELSRAGLTADLFVKQLSAITSQGLQEQSPGR